MGPIILLGSHVEGHDFFHTFATMLQEAQASVLAPVYSSPQERLSAKSEPGLPETSGSADFWGVSGSLLCMVHCVAPQLIALGSIGFGLKAFFESESWTALFWLSCLGAVYFASRKNVFRLNALILWLAFLLFSFAIWKEQSGGSHDHTLSLAGSLTLVGAHIFNHLRNRSWKRALQGGHLS